MGIFRGFRNEAVSNETFNLAKLGYTILTCTLVTSIFGFRHRVSPGTARRVEDSLPDSLLNSPRKIADQQDTSGIAGVPLPTSAVQPSPR